MRPPTDNSRRALDMIFKYAGIKYNAPSGKTVKFYMAADGISLPKDGHLSTIYGAGNELPWKKILIEADRRIAEYRRMGILAYHDGREGKRPGGEV